MRGRYRPRTLRSFEFQLADFRRHILCERPTQVRQEDLLRYLQLRAQTVSLQTAWGYLGRLLPLFRWATQQGHLLWNPGQDLKLPRIRSLSSRVLNVQEVENILQQPGPSVDGRRDRAILEVFYCAGLRREECARLEISDVDLQNKHLRVRESKGGEPRMVPMGDHLVSVLRDYLLNVRPKLASPRSGEALWLSQVTERLSYGDLGCVPFYARKAGLKATAHSLRHAYATHLLEGGAPLRLIQVLLGHCTMQATQVYTHLMPQELLREYRRTHPRAKRKKPRAEPL